MNIGLKIIHYIYLLIIKLLLTKIAFVVFFFNLKFVVFLIRIFINAHLKLLNSNNLNFYFNKKSIFLKNFKLIIYKQSKFNFYLKFDY